MKPRLFVCQLIVLTACTTTQAQKPLTVDANQNEIAYPLWVDKGSRLTFRVSGSWTMWEKWDPVDWRGHTHFKKRVAGYPLGALMGRVEGGISFPVTDGLTHVSPISGRLVLYPNRGRFEHHQASGRMVVAVDGARPISSREAERRSGWDIDRLDTARDASYMSRREKDVVLNLNKARSNPPLFARLYLKPYIEHKQAARDCYRQMLRTRPMGLLKPSRALTQAARDHAKDMGSSGQIGHRGTDGSMPKDRVGRYGRWNHMLAENCSYGYQNPLRIVLQELIDEGVPDRGHRKNVLNRQANYVGVSIKPHKQQRYNCVQDFAGDIEER